MQWRGGRQDQGKCDSGGSAVPSLPFKCLSCWTWPNIDLSPEIFTLIYLVHPQSFLNLISHKISAARQSQPSRHLQDCLSGFRPSPAVKLVCRGKVSFFIHRQTATQPPATGKTKAEDHGDGVISCRAPGPTWASELPWSMFFSSSHDGKAGWTLLCTLQSLMLSEECPVCAPALSFRAIMTLYCFDANLECLSLKLVAFSTSVLPEANSCKQFHVELIPIIPWWLQKGLKEMPRDDHIDVF